MTAAHYKVGDKVSCEIKGETVTGVVKAVTQNRGSWDITIVSDRNSEITGDQGQFSLIAAASDTPPPPAVTPDKAAFPWLAVVVVGALAFHMLRRSK
jgi:hypothetical protein